MAHTSVLLNEVIDFLSPKDGEVFIDATFGAGGYSRAMLDSANCTVYAIDRDLDAVSRAQSFKDEYKNRFHIIHGCFGNMLELLSAQNIYAVDGIAMDLGVSSPQLDEAERGFSFQQDGPLDMRMNRAAGQSAADLVNELSESELADVIYYYGEEKFSRKIAHKIIESRKIAPITTTKQLADIVRSIVPRQKNGLDPATRTFQGIRIKVNEELLELENGLEDAIKLLNNGGRLAVVSFHSLEDRIVKRFMQTCSKAPAGQNRHLPESRGRDNFVAKLSTINRKGISPGDDELKSNPRSRSARLRTAIRIRGENE